MSDTPRILLIDDNHYMLSGLKTLFRNAGYEAFESDNGRDGIDMAEEIQPDLVLLDVVMPDMDGLEVCRRLRMIPSLRNTVIVHLSASRSAIDDQIEALQLGADAYITLPVDNRELVARINALLRLRGVETALRESEQRYRTLVETLPQMVWSCQPDGYCDHFSTQWIEYTGAKDEKHHGDGWLDAIDERDRPRTEEVWRKAIASGKPYEIEHRIVRHDGVPRWFKTEGTPLYDVQDNSITRWYGASTDITDLVEVREALKGKTGELELAVRRLAAQNQLSTLRSEIAMALARTADLTSILQECTDLLVHFLDAAFVRIWVLNRSTDTLELRASSGIYTHLDGEHSRIRVGEFKIGKIAESREAHMTNDVQHDPEINDHEWAKREKMVSFAGYPLMVEDRVLGVIAMFARSPLDNDILNEISLLADGIAQFIDRKNIEQDHAERVREATEAQQEVELLNEIGKIIAAELDLQVLTQEVTDAATRLCKAQFGAFFYNVINPEGESYLLYTISGVPAEKFNTFPMPRNTHVFNPTFQGEGIVRSDDITKDPRYGKNAPYHGMPEGHLPVRSYLAVPVISRTGEVIGGLFFGHEEVGVFGDREERIVSGLAAQAAIGIDNARLFDQLERKVEERTARLRETISELQAFSYTVSHDLRAPLRAMQSYAQILREDYADSFDETAGKYLSRIEGAGMRLDRLIQDLLTYSRISRAEMTIHTVDLGGLIDEVIQQYPMFQSHEAEITVAPDIPDVWGNESSITQTLSNLLGNSIKFVPPERRPHIDISWQKAGKTLKVFVKDNGIGIDTQHHERIFRMFERAPSTQQFEGTGIGLAIVRKAMERIGGNISLMESTENGSTFLLEFRLAQE